MGLVAVYNKIHWMGLGATRMFTEWCLYLSMVGMPEYFEHGIIFGIMRQFEEFFLILANHYHSIRLICSYDKGLK